MSTAASGRTRPTIKLFARLRWRLLRGVFRGEGAQKFATILGFISALLVGLGIGIALAVAGRQSADSESIFVLATVALAAVVVMIGVVAGVTQPVDPRVLAAEPISERQLGIGLLTATAVGPPGLSAVLIGIGLVVGAVRDPVSALPVGLAVVGFLLTLLLISRSTINALGLFATRFPRVGQIVVGLSALVFYGAFQVVPRLVGDIDADERDHLARVLAWTPPGQLGRALGTAGDDPVVAIGHVMLGSVWLVPLGMLFVWTTQRLLVSVKGATAPGRRERRGSPGVVVDGPTVQRAEHLRPNVIRRLCGAGAQGAVAWRGLLTRMRTPRSALETFIGAGIGLAIVLVPTLTRDGIGAGAVLVGGAVQLTVLFMAGNCFGSDGPALANELLTGVDPGVLVRGKARSVLIAAGPVAVIGPLVAAGVTAEWKFLPAGLLVGAGGLFAGTGAAVVQSTVVPIAIPEGDNPLASGDSGKGCLAGLILGALMTMLALVTLPIALALFWALNRESLLLVTLCSVATVGVGLLVFHLGVGYATSTWRTKEPELYAAVIPAR
jgi:hypothetical protein